MGSPVPSVVRAKLSPSARAPTCCRPGGGSVASSAVRSGARSGGPASAVDIRGGVGQDVVGAVRGGIARVARAAGSVSAGASGAASGSGGAAASAGGAGGATAGMRVTVQGGGTGAVGQRPGPAAAQIAHEGSVVAGVEAGLVRPGRRARRRRRARPARGRRRSRPGTPSRARPDQRPGGRVAECSGWSIGIAAGRRRVAAAGLQRVSQPSRRGQSRATASPAGSPCVTL